MEGTVVPKEDVSGTSIVVVRMYSRIAAGEWQRQWTWQWRSEKSCRP